MIRRGPAQHGMTGDWVAFSWFAVGAGGLICSAAYRASPWLLLIFGPLLLVFLTFAWANTMALLGRIPPE